MSGVFRHRWRQPRRVRWIPSAVPAVNATIVAPPALAGVAAEQSAQLTESFIDTRAAVSGVTSPPSTLVVDKIITVGQGLAGVTSPASTISAGNLLDTPPAIVGITSPPETVLATSPDAIVDGVPPILIGAASPPGVVAADNKRPVRETLGGVVSPAPTLLFDKVLAAGPALSGGVIPQPGVVAGTGGIVDVTIVAPPALSGVEFPGQGVYDDTTQINVPAAAIGVLIPSGDIFAGTVGGAGDKLIASPPAVIGVRLSQSGTQRTTRLAVGHGTAGVEFPGKGDYTDIVQSREIPLLSGGVMLAPLVLTNQAPSVEPTVIAPPALCGSRLSVSATQRSSTFTLAHTSVGVLIPGVVGAGGPVAPPGPVEQDWETPAISREDIDDAQSVTVGGHARSRAAVGSSRSGGSSGSATSKK